jgi:PAS domain S-box-containing protein
MTDLKKMFDKVKVAIVASDPDLNVIYANERCKEVFKALLNQEDFVGKNMRECHQAETIEKISALYEEYRKKKRTLDYYTMDIPDGTATIVNVPFYHGDDFAGVVEFVFEGSLA